MRIKKVNTPVLRLAYEDSGPASGTPLLLIHGWPDSPRTWDRVLPEFHEAGYRTIVPYLRGYGPSMFRDRLLGSNPKRTAQPVALAQDMINLADRLRLKRFHVVGHDWGARTGYVLAALFPKRVRSLVAVSVPFAPGKAKPPAMPQVQAFWYTWFLCTKPGEAKLREDPIAFGRAMWDAWSPKGWYTEAEFAEAAKSWQGPDYASVVLHYYRSRWSHAELNPRYHSLQKRLNATETLDTPTMLVHGTSDTCTLAAVTEGAERFFTARYGRVLLNGIGHFPQREAPRETAAAIVAHLRENG